MALARILALRHFNFDLAQLRHDIYGLRYVRPFNTNNIQKVGPIYFAGIEFERLMQWLRQPDNI